jgi:hypothetical protein
MNTKVNCSDGDCTFQFDGICHNEEIDIDDNNECTNKITE